MVNTKTNTNNDSLNVIGNKLQSTNMNYEL